MTSNCLARSSCRISYLSWERREPTDKRRISAGHLAGEGQPAVTMATLVGSVARLAGMRPTMPLFQHAVRAAGD